MDIEQFEAQLSTRFNGAGNWNISPYLSPAEKAANKPILPDTNRSTNRMGAPRNYPGPDTPLLEAEFKSADGRWHTGCFTSIKGALDWLLRQDPTTGMVIA